MHLILASMSPRRREILERCGIPVMVCHPQGVEESVLGDPGCFKPGDLVLHNAKAKNLSLCTPQGDEWILGADTTVVLEGREFGKPRDTAEAFQFLEQLAGRTHEVVSGYFLRHESGVFSGYDVSRVTFRPLTAGDISRYLEQVPVMDKAGAYAIQDGGERIVERLEGSYFNVMGLPVEKILPLLPEPWCRTDASELSLSFRGNGL